MKTARLENVRDSSSMVTGWFGRGRVFLAQVKNEMERVTWPTRKEVYATTLVVILTSFLFGMYLWGIDLVLTRIARFIFETFGAQ
ncbi:MAG: preprotein translocase subunit SecE [Acidobacteriota bacterium]|nr:preprotein translocase subunit SecE [Acidobacteriota bacterium]